MATNQGLTETELATAENNQQTADAQTASKTAVQTKRIIWITGGKGGTGKSTFARGLLDTLRAAGIKVVAFDGDPDNSQLFRFYRHADVTVMRIPIHKRSGADDIITEMEEAQTPIIIVDVPAGGGHLLAGLEDEVGFLSALEEVGYHMTLVTVLSRIKDSLNQLKLAMDVTEGYNNIAHVAVKNLYYGEAHKFRFLERSKTKQRLLAIGGVEVEMADLYEDTYERVDEADSSFLAALQSDSELPKPDVRRLKQWLRHFEKQVRSAEGVLGL